MGSRRQPPLLLLSELTNRVHLVTRYRLLPGGVIEALGEKVDVTNQVGRVLAELDARGLELRPVNTSEQAQLDADSGRPAR